MAQDTEVRAAAVPGGAPQQNGGSGGEEALSHVKAALHTLSQQFWDALQQMQRREIGYETVDRRTGEIKRERVPFSQRIMDRMLFNPVMEKFDVTSVVRHGLGADSVHAGHKMNREDSAKAIEPFVRFHEIDMSHFKGEIGSFKTFNDFFTRELSPGARPTASPDDPTIIVSAADCRLVVFETIKESTKIWIKGNYFSIGKLIEDEEKAKIWTDGPIASFRLSPQDYHHYHSPVDGKVEWWRSYEGTYYCVAPNVTNSKLDELCANARTAICIHSSIFGRMLFVAVGALQVGAVNLTENVKNHGNLCKGDEIGHFSFGGSNVVVCFEKGRVQWDEDLINYSRRKLEANVKVGERIGRLAA